MAVAPLVLTFLCAWATIAAGGEAVIVCAIIIFLSNGLQALILTDRLLPALAVIFLQIPVLCVLVWLYVELDLCRYLSQPSVVAWASMCLVAVLNFTTTRHRLDCVLIYLLLDLILATAAAEGTRGGWQIALYDFSTAAIGGACIVLVPIIVGGLRRPKERVHDLLE